jgi:holo-[acyl-carrier protein] synthase
MIAGIGVDVVGLDRFANSLKRTPALLPRLFAESERTLPSDSLAARFAAKEAFIKALGRSDGVRWVDIEVVSDVHGNPGLSLHGDTAATVERLGIGPLHLTMTHDAGVAIAFVVAESARG